jgi:hypothetical protein
MYFHRWLVLEEEKGLLEKHRPEHMEGEPALALPEGSEVAGIARIAEVLLITAVSTHLQPCCPLCGSPAWARP